MKVINPPCPANCWSDVISPYIKTLPEGFESIAAISSKIGRSRTQTKSIMYKLVEDGKAESILFGQYGAKYYRPVKSVKSK